MEQAILNQPGSAVALADVAVERDVMVPSHDGVRLATDVYRPARDGVALPGPFPVLLSRTPYDKTGVRESEISAADPVPKSNAALAAQFVRQGYAVVMQDCRGRYASQGSFTKYLGEAEDGAATLDWILAQDWCNGRVGTFGLSYAAHTQTALAALRPNRLAAMVLDCGGFSNAYRGGIRHGGAFELKQATWAIKHARINAASTDPVASAALEAEDVADWFAALPWKRGHSPLKWAPEYETYLFDQWERGAFDEYWRQTELHGAAHYAAFAGVPVLMLCGYFDPYAQTTTENFTGIGAQPGAEARMVLGPWLHGRRSQTCAGDVDFGPEAVLDGHVADDYLALRLAWFDRWLKPEGEQAGADLPVVSYFLMGGGSGRRDDAGRLNHGGRWRTASAWPPDDAAGTPLYLSPDARLAWTLPEGEAALSFDFDPADPVPTVGGPITSGEPVMAGGVFDQRTHAGVFGAKPPYLPLAARPDVLVFETAPLAQDVEVAGPISIRLFVSSDAPDTDFTAKLVDWMPPNPDYPRGFALNLTDGIFRCRYRKSWEAPEPLVPGEVFEIVVEPMPTANLFRTGHRIRLDISSSNFPRFDVNPNTGEPEGRARRRRVAVNTVHMGVAHPSRLVLPIRPARR